MKSYMYWFRLIVRLYISDSYFIISICSYPVDWPRPNCVYPDFFSRRVWRDLTGSYRIEVMQGGHEFRITDRFSLKSGTIVYDERSLQAEIKMSLRCYNLYEVITDSSGRFRKQKTYITYTTNDDWWVAYFCLFSFLIFIVWPALLSSRCRYKYLYYDNGSQLCKFIQILLNPRLRNRFNI